MPLQQSLAFQVPGDTGRDGVCELGQFNTAGGVSAETATGGFRNWLNSKQLQTSWIDDCKSSG